MSSLVLMMRWQKALTFSSSASTTTSSGSSPSTGTAAVRSKPLTAAVAWMTTFSSATRGDSAPSYTTTRSRTADLPGASRASADTRSICGMAMPADSASWFEIVCGQRRAGAQPDASVKGGAGGRATHEEPVEDLEVQLGPDRHVREGWRGRRPGGSARGAC